MILKFTAHGCFAGMLRATMNLWVRKATTTKVIMAATSHVTVVTAES